MREHRARCASAGCVLHPAHTGWCLFSRPWERVIAEQVAEHAAQVACIGVGGRETVARAAHRSEGRRPRKGD
jgi:hypothetical protein